MLLNIVRNIVVIQIKSSLHKPQGQAITNFKDKLPSLQSDLAHYTLKDPYIFYFLSIGKETHECEVLKRDQWIGLSNDQIDKVHSNILNQYDFKVDTTAISLSLIARLILKFMNDDPIPKIFQSLTQG